MALIYCSVDKVAFSGKKAPNAVCKLWREIFTSGIGNMNKMMKISNTESVYLVYTYMVSFMTLCF